VEDAHGALLEVAATAEGVDEPAEVFALQRDGHRVDREVAPEEVLADGRVLDGRQGGRLLVELGAGGDDVDPLAGAVEDDGGAEALVRVRAAAERLRERLAERDRVALDGDVDVEAALSEQDVAYRAADQVDALVPLGHGGDGVESRPQPLESGQLRGEARRLPLLLAAGRPEAAEHVAPGDDAEDAPLAEHGDPTPRRAGEQRVELGQRRVLGRGGDAGAHDPLHGRVREAVPDRLVEILARDDAGEAVAFGDEDAALPVALALHHGTCHRLVVRDGAGRRGHDVPRRGRPAQRLGGGAEQPLPRLLERPAEDRRGGLLVAGAAECACERRSIQLVNTAADDREDAPVQSVRSTSL
jgi:hypothetical protein